MPLAILRAFAKLGARLPDEVRVTRAGTVLQITCPVARALAVDAGALPNACLRQRTTPPCNALALRRDFVARTMARARCVALRILWELRTSAAELVVPPVFFALASACHFVAAPMSAAVLWTGLRLDASCSLCHRQVASLVGELVAHFIHEDFDVICSGARCTTELT